MTVPMTLLLSALLSALLAAATVAAADTPSDPGRKSIVAGAVSRDAGGLRGSFRVVASASGIASPGTGGACLVFSRHRTGGAACHVDSDCTLPPDLAGGYAYCLHDGPAAAVGRCWLRPAGNYCMRSRTAPLPLGVDIAFPRDDAGNPKSVSPVTRGWWRVHACLNGAPGACGQIDAPNLQTSDGLPRKFR